jgi:hypothetical protein
MICTSYIETENYGRLKLLSERLVHPAAENVLETYLRSEKVTIHRFLETHKHQPVISLLSAYISIMILII